MSGPEQSHGGRGIEQDMLQLESRTDPHEKPVVELDEAVEEFNTRVERVEQELAELRAELLAIAAELGGSRIAAAIR